MSSSVTLEPHFTNFIEAQVQEGKYGTSEDVIEAGLRLLEEHETKVKALQDALNLGLQSGNPRPFDFEAFKARKRAAIQSR